MNNSITILSQQLADYQGHGVSETHILKWINQFETQDQEFLLSEVNHLISKRYLSSHDAEKYVQVTIESLSQHLNNGSVIQFLLETEFLSLQDERKSQSVLLGILKRIVIEKYGFDIDQNKVQNPKNYIYLDDLLCTGNKFYNDLNNWLNTTINGVKQVDIVKAQNSNVIVVYFFIHKVNFKKKIVQLTQLNGQIISNNFKLLSFKKIDNSFDMPDSKCQVAKPMELSVAPAILAYQKQIETQVAEYVKGRYEVKDEFYRPLQIPLNEELFSSPENRIRFETIVLEKGIEILSTTSSVKIPQMRALGYSLPSFKDFGFGALCFTWRNVPNNTPLVFWYSGGGFIPLFEKEKRGYVVNPEDFTFTL